MARRALLEAFKRFAEPELKAKGFAGRRGHFTRRAFPGVTQVIELQHSIYGGRVTANLGLDLDALKPLVRWLPVPSIGPHAHDATRWIRIGLVRPDPADCWWGFDADTDEGAELAAKSAGRAIVEFGVPWLDTESTAAAFVQYAKARLDRSKTSTHPDGCFLELRLMAATSVLNGDIEGALFFSERAGACWPEERDRLAAARADFRKKNPQVGRKVPEVPDIQAELEELISTTKASLRPGPLNGARPKRSKSSRPRSSPV